VPGKGDIIFIMFSIIERKDHKPQTKKEKALAVLKQLVFVKEYPISIKGYVYRITRNKSLSTTSYLNWHSFREGVIFKEADLLRILKNHGLTINDLNISNRR